MGYDIIERYQCGSSVTHTSPNEIADEIRKIKELDNAAYADMCKNARIAAEAFDIPSLSNKYLNEIDRILKNYKLKHKKKGDGI